MWFLLTYYVLNLKVKEKKEWLQKKSGRVLFLRELTGSWGRRIFSIKHKLPTVTSFLLSYMVSVLTPGPLLPSCRLSGMSCDFSPGKSCACFKACVPLWVILTHNLWTALSCSFTFAAPGAPSGDLYHAEVQWTFGTFRWNPTLIWGRWGKPIDTWNDLLLTNLKNIPQWTRAKLMRWNSLHVISD